MSAARWIKRIAGGVGVVAAAALLSGASYERAMRERSIHDFPVPGRLVDVGGGRRIQLDCRGQGSPTVVLESGLDTYGSLAWAAVHDSIAATTRVCAYSRAGIMWSDPSSAPFDSRAVASDLHTALTMAGEAAPWVMVGHSLGGPYATVFTKLYGAEVAGVVLVDPTHPDQFARFREIAGKSLVPSAGLVRFGAAVAWTGLVRAQADAKTPASWPREIGQIAPAFLSTSVAGLAKEVEAIPATLRAAGELQSFGDRPFIVLTAGLGQPSSQLSQMGLTAAQGEQIQAASRALHADQAARSRNGKHIVVPDASHYIQFERPDAVIRAVRDVVRSVHVMRKF
jgi:pimeloyl-ACP methyl ester carboxylesterase